ncbi:hypothetical protein Rsub_07146 [Raphidocelis subcapitata]|uniref:PDZ domain-containing protein n=1 Tax=Raphidocelis subcapitata TaxID=307507 RepID=A0A2V0P3J6_9CHLO|nr:hypothetical protein Rsub_07146 [Raphidocelis subcapitata]|eukprot:GBF94159.1 hypothetical protein Rsub_07146 [Raphidocelis subcapitata]
MRVQQSLQQPRAGSRAAFSGAGRVAQARVVARRRAPLRTVAQAGAATEEFVELDLPKPLGLKFARGNDGGAYVIKNDPALGNTDPRIQPGDKVVQISASFGSDIWDAQNFGQIMYAIRTRNGDVYLKIKRNFGDMSAPSPQGALVDFENVAALEPRNFVGDSGARVTPIMPVTLYNIACAYSMVGSMDEGLKALEKALSLGFEDYGKVRSDPNLKRLRDESGARFEELVNSYDEPVINMEAIKATFGVFGKLFSKN